VTPAEVVDALLRATQRRDADAMAALVTGDALFEPASAGDVTRAPYHGPEGVRAWLADSARDWDEFTLTVNEVREAGDLVVVLARIYARRGGQVIDSPVGVVHRVRDGRVSWAKTFVDRADALRAAGLA